MSAEGIDFALTRSGLTVEERLVLMLICHKLRDNSRMYKMVTSLNALTQMLEMTDYRCRKALSGLREKGMINWRAIEVRGKPKTEVIVNVVDPFLEDKQIVLADNKTALELDMFNNHFWPSYPRHVGREQAWQAWQKLIMTEDLFFKIMEDLAYRLEHEWSSRSASVVPTPLKYISARIWDKPSVPAMQVIKSLSQVGNAKATRLNPEWQLPRAWGDWALENSSFTGAEIIEMGEHFRDYWVARADKGAVKLDWLATWRNWVRSQKQRQPKTFAQQTREFKEERGKEAFSNLGGADSEALKKWGF